MASFFYQIAIFLYALGVRVASLFNQKAKLFISGRKDIWQKLKALNKPNIVWFHAASLGEFEQGKPVMEQLKKNRPEINLVVTFFSPSGYEEKKDWPLADVFYLPIDSKRNAKKLVQILQPKLAVFIRYEFWANYMDALYTANIPTTVIAAQFRKDQFAFKPLGSFIRKKIARMDAILVQYESAQKLLLAFGFDENKTAVCGDSRFDRVLATVEHAKHVAEIEAFKGDAPVLILGSCYEKEEAFVAEVYNNYPDWKFIYAPHYVDDARVSQLKKRLPGDAIRITNYQKGNERILILNTIGKLAAAYQYGDIAVVGGGFRDGIHNILEPAAFGLPVFYGPNHNAFPEGQALIDEKLGFEIDTNGNAKAKLLEFMSSAENIAEHKKKLQQFVKNHAGATKCITNKLESYLN